jgi:F-type H+-transporting ATPase subunit gamma
MANARIIVKRRKTVTNIKKITHTMQLIATAKFQKCQARATASRPYTDRITELVSQLSSQVTDIKHPLLEVNCESKRAAVLTLVSNRGLCGSYNANVLRTALGRIRDLEKDDTAIDLDVAGKKGIAYFRFLGRDMRRTYTDFDDKVRFDQVDVLANEFMKRYQEKEIDSVHVVYMRFVSASRQRPTAMQLLPLQQEPSEQQTEQGAAPEAAAQYEFSPEPVDLLAELLPATVRIRLFQCFTEGVVSEQISRMVAMKAATDAAGDMIKILTRTYNRARQSQITMELLDIMGGAEALS